MIRSQSSCSVCKGFRDAANLRFDFTRFSHGGDPLVAAHAHGELPLLPQVAIPLDRLDARIAIANARDPDGIVVGEEELKTGVLVVISRSPLGGLHLHVAGAVSQDA